MIVYRTIRTVDGFLWYVGRNVSRVRKKDVPMEAKGYLSIQWLKIACARYYCSRLHSLGARISDIPGFSDVRVRSVK